MYALVVVHGVTGICVSADEGGHNIILQKLILSVADRTDLELDLKGLWYSMISRTLNHFVAWMS